MKKKKIFVLLQILKKNKIKVNGTNKEYVKGNANHFVFDVISKKEDDKIKTNTATNIDEKYIFDVSNQTLDGYNDCT